MTISAKNVCLSSMYVSSLGNRSRGSGKSEIRKQTAL